MRATDERGAFSVRLGPGQLLRLTSISKREDRSVAYLLRDAVRRYLAEYDDRQEGWSDA